MPLARHVDAMAHIRGAVIGVKRAAGHVLVDVVEALIVTEIKDHASILRDD